jgi:DNA-binding response OmpR family regulator
VRGIVLLVEPEAPLRWSLGNALVNRGYSVAEAATLPQALALLGQVTFDLLVISPALPAAPGGELLRTLAEAVALTTPVMLLPVREPLVWQEHLLSLGTALPQPPWLEDLLRAIERIKPAPGSPATAVAPLEAEACEG